MMRETCIKISAVGLFMMSVACKRPASSASDSGVSTTDVTTQIEKSPRENSLLNAQEFYEIAKNSYIKKMKTLGPTALSDAEQRFLEKFQVNPESSGQVVQFVETMFEILESGRYGLKLKAIPAGKQVSRPAPEGLTDFDVKKFFEMIKMDYFKKVTKRPAPDMDERERNFFERIQRSSSENYDYKKDYLLISSDLFDTIEGL